MTPSGKNSLIERHTEIIIHICIWIYVFASPLVFRLGKDSIDWIRYLQQLYFPITSCVIFYLNYVWLVPKYALGKKHNRFIVINLAIVILMIIGRDYYEALLPPSETMLRRLSHSPKHLKKPSPFVITFMQVRNAVSLMFIALVALTIRLSLQWHKAESARRKAEFERQEAELQNIKNQINPHFLLNTLNNIYALTAFDAERAQKAIQELSQLLRYVLYENQSAFVDLRKEADFLKTYTALMRIRLTDIVDVQLNISLPKDTDVKVGPLIFISLVENAFKHGINPTKPSFIHIDLTATPKGKIEFICTNSNHPKSSDDKTPGGIGLQQVRKRLEHTYASRYTWVYGITPQNNTIYKSAITIEPTL